MALTRWPKSLLWRGPRGAMPTVRRLSQGRRHWFAAAVVAATFGQIASAEAALSMSASSSPPELSYGLTTEVTFSVALTATERDETFAFAFRTLGFGSIARPTEGAPLRYSDQRLNLQGGTLLGPGAMQIATM